jgi:TRAF-interacting protein
LIRDLRSSKKFKADQTKSCNITSNSAFGSPSFGYENDTIKLDEVMEDPWSGKSHSDNLKPEGTSDLNAEVNVGKKDVIDLDADDSVFRNEHKAEFSAKLYRISSNNLDSQSKSGLCQNDDRQSTCFEYNTTYAAKETSFMKHSDAIGKSTFQENLTAKLHILLKNPILGTMKAAASTSTREEEIQILTIGGISKQVSQLSSGTGPQQIHNLNPLPGVLYGLALVNTLCFQFA